MKKLILAFVFLFTMSVSFTSCRETAKDDAEVEMEVDDEELEIEGN